ncbi:uncharacterized protein Z518_00465 [Rhinocladiella mackenziei CBS 650.93]|uniref:Major facilitator superfamily (MFS) profile domain-containing protein n=1 Tax=Rhinocladiella mackenziei CBS 650.93 TaxID=1442369 RepID=A0A0D2J117_9EURO|nr:uncharacterized protein Z518_00465 [Rhinocladiella mackenziei CBS 650.93]KIX09386.1 hypothetical protein Z518_00465 [Rhinocladiella mackenziei CBS 650.93]
MDVSSAYTLGHPEPAPVQVDEKQPDSRDDQSSTDIHDDNAPPEHIPIDPGPIYWSQHTLPKRPWRTRVTDFAKIAEAHYRGSGTPSDPFIVQWLDDDPENPKSYHMWLKIPITALVAFMTLCVSLASSAYTGALKDIMREFHCSEEVSLLGLSTMVLGFAFGGLVFAPLSEAMGRRDVQHVALIFYTMWTAVCIAAQNIWTLIIFRFFCGVLGSAVFVIPGGQVADLFESEQRGVAISIYAAAPFLGPTLGPLVGGFLAEGRRMAVGHGSAGITYAPVLLRRRAQLLSTVTGKSYMTQIDMEHPLVLSEVVRRSLVRPWALLFREPVVFLFTIYMGVVYGTLYLCFAAFPIVFQQGYGWNAGQGGLAFLGIMVGMLIGVAIIVFDNKRYARLHREAGGSAPPETRLPPVILGGAFTIIGLAWFAATNDPGVHFIVPILAGVPFGAGFLLVFMSSTNYLIDSYVIFAASVLAANSILRSTFGAVFPLFTIYMYRDLGVHWASAVPGFIALACFPFPIIFYQYGHIVRRQCQYSAQAARYLDSLQSNLERKRSRASADAEAAGKKRMESAV